MTARKESLYKQVKQGKKAFALSAERRFKAKVKDKFKIT